MNGLRTLARGLGQTLITFGVVVLLFCAYELWVTNLYTSAAQDDLRQDLTKAWAAGPDLTSPTLAKVQIGEGLAILRIPRLGSGYAPVVVEGVGRDDLRKGPGHYPGTAAFGALGNAVVSGHRTTYGGPFNRLDEVRTGDAVVVETRSTWFTYTVRKISIVSPHAVEVTYPVPGKQGARPTERLLTLTTCHPKYSARTRLILQAVLSDTRAKTAGLPPALQAGT